jgi:type IV secretory pathway TrbL component
MMRAHREARAAQHKRMVEIAAAQPAASDDGLEMASSPTGAQEASKGNELLSQMFGESHST